MTETPANRPDSSDSGPGGSPEFWSIAGSIAFLIAALVLLVLMTMYLAP